MVLNNIKFVGDLEYATHEELLGVVNGKEIIEQWTGEKIPIQLLEFDNNESSCIVLAGHGAMYPWKVGQKVELGFAKSFVKRLKYLREMAISGFDNAPYQDFIMYDSIEPIKDGEYFPDKDAPTFKGIISFEWFKELGELFCNDNYNNFNNNFIEDNE